MILAGEKRGFSQKSHHSVWYFKCSFLTCAWAKDLPDRCLAHSLSHVWHIPATPVIVSREGIYQLGAVLTMEENLIVDFLFVSIQFGFGVAIVLTVFGDTEMLDVYGTISLSDDEVRGIWFV